MRYRDHVAKLLDEASNQPKSERTRLRLKLGAIDVLEEIGYLNARTTDITARAELSIGSFYVYFADKKVMTVELMTDFVRFLDEQNRSAMGGSDPFAIVLAKTTQYVRVFSSNAGLLRCLHQLCDLDVDFQQVWNDTNYKFSGIFADGMARRQNKRMDANLLRLVGYALASMIDELLRLLYVVGDPRLLALAGSHDHVAEVISVLWYRAIYGRDPEERWLRFTPGLLDLGGVISPDAVLLPGERPASSSSGSSKLRGGER